MKPQPSRIAASHGEPSYVWRAGQERRLQMIINAAGDRLRGRILEDGCGVGLYLERFQDYSDQVFGLEYDHGRARKAHDLGQSIVQAAGERLPFPESSFDLVISHEVIEHVEDDRKTIQEAVRALRPGGRLILFCPNRGYPFETHGMYWKGNYIFGNIPLLNYLPSKIRDRLVPHVRVYRSKDLVKLFHDLPVRWIQRSIIFGGYDNITAKFPRLGKGLRWFLHRLENTPLNKLGLSHFWVVEKRNTPND